MHGQVTGHINTVQNLVGRYYKLGDSPESPDSAAIFLTKQSGITAIKLH